MHYLGKLKSFFKLEISRSHSVVLAGFCWAGSTSLSTSFLLENRGSDTAITGLLGKWMKKESVSSFCLDWT